MQNIEIGFMKKISDSRKQKQGSQDCVYTFIKYFKILLTLAYQEKMQNIEIVFMKKISDS